ncbi:MAG: 16S rRNA (uracil(1498)-N(3))-methyltransferase [Lentisphaeria bacterium]|nr:16S rRNA (uracil(1498)-N(3))-methyltransferase [Lentisphaeria bacterium]
MNLLLLTEEDRCGNVFEVTERRAEHIRTVLRASCGDTIKCGMLNGKIGNGILLELERNRAKIQCDSFDLEPPPKNNIIPIISLPRPQSFKKTLHFIASAGIAKAFFVGSAKVEKSYWKSSAMQPENILEEIKLGLEQGVDTIEPELIFYPELHTFFEKEESFLQSCQTKIIAHPEPGAPLCPHALSSETPVLLAIGPEGGYTTREVEVFRNHGFNCVSLGRNILRVEFALSVLCGKLCP